MKLLVFISFLIISTGARSQIDWLNYSTSFQDTENNPSLGVAIPYNGNYDNFDKNIVGISHWNPRYNLNIDTTLDSQIPLFFVYDTTGIHFLVPHVNEKNAADFEFTILLNNKITVTPWSPVTQFTQNDIGGMKAGNGITGNYSAGLGQYLVAHLRNRQGRIISSVVIYFKKNAPEIESISTSDNSLAFSNLVNTKDHFSNQMPDVGWHRQYTADLSEEAEKLKLSYNENNILIHINSKIYQKEALEYILFKNGMEIREWGANEFNNNYILLKDLDPGNYTIHIRYKRQPDSVSKFNFSVSTIWYKTAVFRAAVLALLVLTVAFFLFLSKYRKQNRSLVIADQKAEQSEGELKNIHTLLNPHFTFNALNSIQGLVNKGDMDAASAYLSSFGELLRETLKESKIDLIPVTKELENLKIYISLEQLRYPFDYNLAFDENLDQFTLTIPPFLLQPFVENAIKHGFSKMDGRGILNVSINKQDDNMIVRISDNGPGFDTVSVKQGFGLELSSKRIELLNRKYGEKLIDLKIDSSNSGTSVLLLFKNWL